MAVVISAYDPALDSPTVLQQPPQSLGVGAVLLLEDARRQRVRVVTLQHRHRPR